MDWEIAELWKSVGMQEGVYSRPYGYMVGQAAPPAGTSTPTPTPTAPRDTDGLQQHTPEIEKVNDIVEVEVVAQEEVEVSSDSVGSGGTQLGDLNPMGMNYQKCKAARGSALKKKVTEVGFNAKTGLSEPTEKGRVGNLDLEGDVDLLKTFRGTRLSAYGSEVNQSITCSFDPGTLICLVCKKEHSIINQGEGFVMIVTDQNFVPTLAGGGGCIPIVRVEDASLLELCGMAGEILDGHVLPPGALFMVGSASHLSKVGTTLYTMEWQSVSENFGKRWRDSIVSPLVPLLREDCDGTVGRSLLELKYWYNVVYGNSICFFENTWKVLEEVLVGGAGEGLVIDPPEVYTIPLPHSLTDRKLVPFSFRVSSTHTKTASFGEGTGELIRALFVPLSTQFGCKADPDEILLVRELNEREGPTVTGEKELTVIVIGGSHMRRTVGELRYRGFKVVDLSVPGWVPSEGNIEKLVTQLKDLKTQGDTVSVCDFVSNVVYRAVNLGVEGMPCKIAGKYHMPGKVSTCSKESLKSFLLGVRVVMENLPGLKVVVPPLPRYLFRACCPEQGHCEGVGTNQYPGSLLEKTLNCRRVMKDFLVGQYSDTVVVPDLVQKMFPDAKSTTELLVELEQFSANDGVHLVGDGYGLVADVLKCIITEHISAAVSVSGGKGGGKPVFWKGFLSPVGSSRPKNTVQNYKHTHQTGGKWKNQRLHTQSAVYGSRLGSGPSGSKRN